VLIDNGAVAVFGPDGAPHIDLSVRCFPRCCAGSSSMRRMGRGAGEEIELDAAVLIQRRVPRPKLCHF